MKTDTAAQGLAAEEITHQDAVADQAFGFWLYVMSDLVLFAAIIATYIVLSHNFAGGPTADDLFHLPYVLAETILLLISSATYGFAMLAMQEEKNNQVGVWLAVTFLFGLGFIVMEINEFHSMITAGNGPDRSGFLSGLFTLVGTHGAHVICGLVWMAVMIGQVVTRGLTVSVQSRLMRLGIFWHFLDIVWVGVFTIVYLMGVL